MSTDADWEKLGKNDPYYGVLTHEKFRTRNIDQKALQEFFDSGAAVVTKIFALIDRHLDSNFRPVRALEFGCGTGRLLVAAARRVDEMVGVDVSASMLEECARNCDKFNIDNVRLDRSDDQLSCLSGEYDLIYSYIVFQHIPVERGKVIFAKLLDHLAYGGVGAIYINYAKADSPGVYGNQFPGESESHRLSLGKIRTLIGQSLPGRKNRNSDDAVIQMNTYLLNDLLHQVQSKGIQSLHVELEDHGGELGAFLFFKNFDKAFKGLFVSELDHADFVEECYRVILDRPADDDGREHYRNQLASGAMSRNQLITVLVNSNERQQRDTR